MPLQRALLRITLLLLAVAAGAAILAVLSGSSEVLWRIFGTCLLAALASGAVIRLSPFLDKPELRPAAISGFSTTAVAFGLLLFSIWMDTFGFRTTGHMVGTGVAVAAIGLIATSALSRRGHAEWSLAAPAVAITAGLCLIGLLTAIWTEDQHTGQGTFTAGPILIAAALCLVAPSPRARSWRYLGLIAALPAAILAIHQSILPQQAQSLWHIYTILASTLGVIVLANLLMLFSLDGQWRYLRSAAVSAAALTAAGISYVACAADFAWNSVDPVIARGTGALAIVTACSTIALLIRHRLDRRIAAVDAARTAFTTLTVICPRCHTRQDVPLGISPCTGCRLLISARLAEPRCANCNYSLLDLKENRCPECGHPIPAPGLPIPEQPQTVTLR